MSSSELVGRAEARQGRVGLGAGLGVGEPGGERARSVDRWSSQMTLNNTKGLLCQFQCEILFI